MYRKYGNFLNNNRVSERIRRKNYILTKRTHPLDRNLRSRKKTNSGLLHFFHGNRPKMIFEKQTKIKY